MIIVSEPGTKHEILVFVRLLSCGDRVGENDLSMQFVQDSRRPITKGYPRRWQDVVEGSVAASDGIACASPIQSSFSLRIVQG